ncbi:MAG: sugar phosphate isomerase/epimerase [Treponema sp.]|nr:sugar phosphate isomerase/epimerase [Treponema sp.]
MRLSTVTNLFMEYENSAAHPDRDTKVPFEESMKRCLEIGFTVQDASVSDSGDNKNHPLNNDGWERWIDHIGNLKEKLGIQLDSAHLPFFYVEDPRFRDPEKRAFVERAKYRSIQACGAWGVKWAVEHITHNREDAGFMPLIKKKSLEYTAPFIEAAAKANVGIAFENMVPTPKVSVRYMVTAWELIDFVESIKASNVGICWDFGHANLVYTEQTKPLRQLGKWLKATHVHDNWGKEDVHMVPFVGNIKWEPIMKILTEIGYKSNFTLELGPYNWGKPDYIQTMHAQHAYKTGEYLLSLA